MSDVTLKGNRIQTSGSLPAVGSTIPDSTLTGTDLADVRLSSFKGKKVLNIFPSLDTAVCATSVRTFNKKAAGRKDVTVLNISMDLPFAHKRFCASEGIEGVVNLSAFRSKFPEEFGVKILGSGMAGLCARAVVVLDQDNKVLYTQLVPEITTEPDYEAALAKL